VGVNAWRWWGCVFLFDHFSRAKVGRTTLFGCFMFEVFHSYETVPFVVTALTTKIKTDAFF
jgi:hypothetical protein